MLIGYRINLDSKPGVYYNKTITGVLISCSVVAMHERCI